MNVGQVRRGLVACARAAYGEAWPDKFAVLDLGNVQRLDIWRLFPDVSTIIVVLDPWRPKFIMPGWRCEYGEALFANKG